MLFVEIITNFGAKKHIIKKKDCCNCPIMITPVVIVKKGNIIALGVKNATFLVVLNTMEYFLITFAKNSKNR